MPFTTKADREKVKNLMVEEIDFLLHQPAGAKLTMADSISNENITVGDKCNYFYLQMMQKWNKSRRWTTAHAIYATMKNDVIVKGYADDTKRAYELAWGVFFQMHVMPYEFEKKELNGDILGDGFDVQ